MNRTDRLLSLVAKLQTERWQRAEDLADGFGVSVRTIYRDMQDLEEAGVPIVAIPGKGYRLGVQQGQQLTLQAGLQAVPAEVFEDPADLSSLQPVRRALAEQRVIQFTEHTGGDGAVADRTVNPYGLFRRSGRWQLVGYDQTAARVRHFPLHRVQQLEVLDEHFDRPPSYGMHQDTDVGRDLTVRVWFAPAVASWVRETPPVFTERIERDGEAVILTLRVRREAEMLPWLLSWGTHVQVLEPASLRRRLAEEAQKIAAKYQAEPELFL